MEDTTNDPARTVAREARSYFRKYRYEWTLMGIGAVASYALCKRRYERRQDAMVANINDHLREAFRQNQGNFRTEGGGYVVPVWKFK